MACIFWATATREVLAQQGVATALVAGSAQFQMRIAANDDGISPTHFAYMFEAERVAGYLQAGRLPEMHAWVVTDRNELIDMTTGFQENQMRRMIGDKWDAELALPDVLWSAPDAIPYPQMVYRPDARATAIALTLLRYFRESTLQGA